eukprot:GHVS01042441.1.p1 GENE.GHVS01042441.1~~GHVS01042441.1.p1  ORF type:complete len:295 (-),score=59.20 GHVS01042441.1:331-1215(-)
MSSAANLDDTLKSAGLTADSLSSNHHRLVGGGGGSVGAYGGAASPVGGAASAADGGSLRGGGGPNHYIAGSGRRAPNTQVQQLFARLNQEIEDQKPSNMIHFMVDFLCKHYPEHLQGFASVWNGDPDLEKERLLVVEFFKAQKLPTEIAAHFTNAGFDTLETLCTLTSESLDDIERFNQTRWLPGHKVRLQQTFSDIAGRVRVFREDREALIRAVRGNMSFCHHPTVVSKANIIPPRQFANSPNSTNFPALTYCRPPFPISTGGIPPYHAASLLPYGSHTGHTTSVAPTTYRIA